MLADPLGPLVIRWSHLPWVAPWLLRFLIASRPSAVERISVALKSLLDHAVPSFEVLLDGDQSGAALPGGLLYAYCSTESFRNARDVIALRRRRGVRLEELSRQEAVELEPELPPSVQRVIYFREARSVADPPKLVSDLLHRFTQDGGHIVSARAVSVRRTGRALLVDTTSETLETGKLVVAAGAWSSPLLSTLGLRVPLDTERGYVAHLESETVALKRPVIYADRDVAISPVARGVRVAGTVELGGLTRPPDPRRASKLEDAAREFFPGVSFHAGTWTMGFRPSLPDSMPVIGLHPSDRDVILAFGHGHLGLTLGPLSGRLVAQLASGGRPMVDLAPFRVDRFRGPLR